MKSLAPIGVVDCFVHHQWASQADLLSYMSPGWRSFLGAGMAVSGALMPKGAVPPPSYRHPVSDTLLAAAVDGKPAGSDPDVMTAQLLEGQGIDHAVLGFDQALLAPVTLNPYLGLEVARAANAWSIDRWSGKADSRFSGLILAPNHVPEEAVKEIQARARSDFFAGVLMCGNGLGKPFGHPAYHSIYRAAAESDLPLIVHAGGDAPPNTLTHPVAGGPAATFAEAHAFRGQSLMTHLTSLIINGVLEKFPNLKVMIVGAGVTWIPGYLWRLDGDFKAYAARETPWLARLPSEQFLQQVRVATYSTAPTLTARQVTGLLQTFDGLDDVICFASGYPRWDTDRADHVSGLFPANWRDKILRKNAAAFFRWAASSAPASGRVFQETT